MPLYKRLEPFEEDGFGWPVYEAQVPVFLRANDATQEKQRDIFLASCRTCIFSLLLNLLKPATPHGKSFIELLKVPVLLSIMLRVWNNWAPYKGMPRA
ncbi:hypothetical protein HPB50_008952 [Hyalomma asiaticum]|uniref:Uncharacterized protein n=1 Tax=Hyalomma asiaticum TaxID=266040 RepID=A0ACB7S1M3_HYAAI|nr:hypothetical protein HPB50_008952 [Hyalomma asiaticum]